MITKIGTKKTFLNLEFFFSTSKMEMVNSGWNRSKEQEILYRKLLDHFSSIFTLKGRKLHFKV